MSSKKTSRTPSGGKKVKRKEDSKNDAHSKKSIKSFFRPVSDRSLCRTSSSTGKISNEDDCIILSTDEIVHPSPLKAGLKGKDGLKVKDGLKLKSGSKIKVGLDSVFISPIKSSNSESSFKDVNDEHDEIKLSKLELKNKNIHVFFITLIFEGKTFKKTFF